MFINRGLPGSRREERNFKRNNLLHIDDGWPPYDSRPSQDDFANSLANYLWEVDTRFGGPVRHHPDQICHFSCHSDTGANRLPNEYMIILQSGWIFGSRVATLQKLENALSALSQHAEKDKRHRPLIFMNSCGSGDLDPSGSSSFPDLFLNKDLGFTGFIGTETVMPNDFASEFSIRFYEKLMKGCKIGEAILLTRWDLLSDYHNPMGLMYTLFAEPEIQVRSPVREFPSLPPSGRMARIVAGLRGKF
jgi:hypothetical protein